MKKLLKITCLFFLVSITVQAQNDLLKENLKGRVKSVTTSAYNYKDSKKGALESKLNLKFNEKGNKSEENKYSNGIMGNQMVYIYNSEQKLAEINMLHIKEVVDYDEYGDEIKTGKTKSELYGASIYTYDDKGNCIEERVEYPKGSISSKIVYTYDDKGNQLTVNEYQRDDKLKKRSVSKYDEKNNKTETINYLADGKVDVTYKFTYDAKGNQLEWNDYTNGILSFKRVYKYDDRGNRTELATFVETGTLYNKVVNTYDDKGNELTETAYGTDGSTTYVYVYDTAGNWTSKQRVFDKPYSVEERVIEYY